MFGSGSNDNTANINGSSGTIQMWYSDHTEGGAIEIKKAGTYKLDFNRSDNKLSYTEVTQATTPYIFVDGSSKPFTKSYPTGSTLWTLLQLTRFSVCKTPMIIRPYLAQVG